MDTQDTEELKALVIKRKYLKVHFLYSVYIQAQSFAIPDTMGAANAVKNETSSDHL